jgi:hypothetical protein
MHHLQGQRFGRLTALRFVKKPNSPKGHAGWICRCDCGSEVFVITNNLIKGNSTSCGCKLTESRYKHGMSKTSVYRVWTSMWQRCTNPKSVEYHNYGGCGITVCDEWQDFNQFITDMGMRPSGFQLDRIDNNKGYYKENCRWTPQELNLNNRRVNRVITFDGFTGTIAQWAERLGINYRTLNNRINRGWPLELALRESVQGGWPIEQISTEPVTSPSVEEIRQPLQVKIKTCPIEDPPDTSHADMVKRFEAKVAVMPNGCHEWQAKIDRGGYGKFWINGFRLAHRVAWELFVGPVPERALVLHKCDNRRCVNPDHLYLGTHWANVRDKVVRNHSKWGRMKIPHETVVKARELYATGQHSQQQIAEMLGIKQVQVSRYVRKVQRLYY